MSRGDDGKQKERGTRTGEARESKRGERGERWRGCDARIVYSESSESRTSLRTRALYALGSFLASTCTTQRRQRETGVSKREPPIGEQWFRLVIPL